jgi:adenosine deaminase
LATVIGDLTRAQKDARRKLGIDSQLVMCFMRELSADSAMAVLESARAFKRHLVGVGLDSAAHAKEIRPVELMEAIIGRI